MEPNSTHGHLSKISFSKIYQILSALLALFFFGKYSVLGNLLGPIERSSAYCDGFQTLKIIPTGLNKSVYKFVDFSNCISIKFRTFNCGSDLNNPIWAFPLSPQPFCDGIDVLGYKDRMSTPRVTHPNFDCLPSEAVLPRNKTVSPLQKNAVLIPYCRFLFVQYVPKFFLQRKSF